MDKSWSETEIDQLKLLANGHDIDDLAQRFETDTETVQAKIDELGLLVGISVERNNDPLLGTFAEAMKLLGEKDHAGASAQFEKVIAETDGRHLRDRARQLLKICQQQISDEQPIDDPYLAAVFEKNEGQIDEALALCEQADPGDERFVYLKASLKALAEEEEQALEHLEKAIALEPKNRVYAFHDPDFETLRGTEGFTALINPPKAQPAPAS